MKKLVIALVIIAILAVAGYFLFLKPRTTALTAESAGEMALSACTADLNDLALLLGAVEEDESQCYKLGTDMMKYYCLAWFGIDFCIDLPKEEQTSCTAILNRKPADCDNDMCFGILGDEAGCSDSTCTAFARRDLNALKNPSLCDQIVARAARDVGCFENAQSVKELDACINQSIGR